MTTRGRTGLVFLAVFAAAAVAAGLGRAVTTTYLPLLLHEAEAAPGTIGTAMLVNAAAGFAVPLLIGLWRDRVRGPIARRLPFITGGTLLTAGGLAAIALDSETSYLVLTGFGAVVYVGLNVITTAHRALVRDSFDPRGRARANASQEVAILAGGLIGIVGGGAFTEVGSWAPFAFAALAVPLLAVPTLARVRRPLEEPTTAARMPPIGYYLDAMIRPGVRELLTAQVLWMLGYAAMPVFFVLYAQQVLELEPSAASFWLAGFGVVSGLAMLAAGRVDDPARFKALLMAGVAAMGAGFLGVAAAGSSVTGAAVALLPAAVGFGVVSTLGFAFFSMLIPAGEAGAYSALYFAARPIASATALPAAGWTIEATGKFGSLFFFGGMATLAALAPLAAVSIGARAPHRRARPGLPVSRWWARWAAGVAGLYVVVLSVGLLNERTLLHRLDEALFLVINRLGPGPEALWHLLNPHTRNYLALSALAAAAALLTAPRRLPTVLPLVVLSGLLAWGLLEGVYNVYDRPRPEEAVTETQTFGNTWGFIESYPSGHMAITTALAAAAWLAFPALRLPLLGYVVAVAFTRVLFGSHFPLDTVAGVALGYGAAYAVRALFDECGLLEPQPKRAASTRAVSRTGRKELAPPS